MKRTMLLAAPLAAVLVAAGCSGTPDTLLSPSAVLPASADVNADGSTLKVSPPSGLAPGNGAVADSTRPTLTFEEAAGRFASAPFSYDIEVQDAAGNVAYYREGVGAGSHVLESALAASTTYWWRVRARAEGAVGPWSEWAAFNTPAGGGGGPIVRAVAGELPFFVPEVCLAGNGAGCVIAMTEFSPWWPACRAGSGTNCHRFVRSVAAALAVNDPNWGLITKNPGEQQCTWDGCGPGNGSGYGEDIVAYHTGNGNWVGWDTITGAGAPGASPNWAQVSGRRPGNNWTPVPPFP